MCRGDVEAQTRNEDFMHDENKLSGMYATVASWKMLSCTSQNRSYQLMVLLEETKESLGKNQQWRNLSFIHFQWSMIMATERPGQWQVAAAVFDISIF